MATLVRAGQRVLILLPGRSPGSVGELLVEGLARMGATGFIHGPVRDPEGAIEKIIERQANCLVGIPVQVLSLIRQPQSDRIPWGVIRSVLLGTAYAPASMVDDIEGTWGCKVYQHYGMTEMGYGGGVECGAHDGYHLREADLFVEIVDPETGAPLSGGIDPRQRRQPTAAKVSLRPRAVPGYRGRGTKGGEPPAGGSRRGFRGTPGH